MCDFSSDRRSLESLLSREPPLSSEDQTVSRALLATISPMQVDLPPNEENMEGLWSLSSSDRWECLAAFFRISTNLLGTKTPYMMGPVDPSVTTLTKPADSEAGKASGFESSLRERLFELIPAHLSHPEPRVRTLVSQAIAAISSDPSAYSILYSTIWPLITSTYKNRESTTSAVDDTAGWRELETSLQAYASLCTSCPHPDLLSESDMKVLFECCTQHVNRHVRAAGLLVLHTYLTSPVLDGSKLEVGSTFLGTMNSILDVNLSDNWSQVRMSASVLLRSLLAVIPDATPIYPTIIPHLSLNRFYLADGVRLHSRETWKRHISDPIGLLCANISATLRHYIKKLDADNHVVRESTCNALTSLSASLPSNPELHAAVLPHVPLLLPALVQCSYDESWPVRDAAAVTVTHFIRSFPDQSRPYLDQHFYAMLRDMLGDQIWSVRADAAAALATVRDVYPDYTATVDALIPELLPLAATEPKRSKADVARDVQDRKLHSNTQLFSCGSLAPKLHKSANRVAGCSDCMVTRDRRPWESTDGAVFLVRELIVTLDDDALVPLIDQVIEAVRHEHFVEADELRRTAIKVFTALAGLDKKRFKRHYLSRVLPTVCRILERGDHASRLVHFDAECWIRHVRSIVGDGILRGRADEMVGSWAADLIDRVSRDQPMSTPMEEQMKESFSGNNFGGYGLGAPMGIFPKAPAAMTSANTGQPARSMPPKPPTQAIAGLSLNETL